MATAKAKPSETEASAPDTDEPRFEASVRLNDVGDYVLGFEVDGAFIPVASKLGVHVDAAVAKHKRRLEGEA